MHRWIDLDWVAPAEDPSWLLARLGLMTRLASSFVVALETRVKADQALAARLSFELKTLVQVAEPLLANGEKAEADPHLGAHDLPWVTRDQMQDTYARLRQLRATILDGMEPGHALNLLADEATRLDALSERASQEGEREVDARQERVRRARPVENPVTGEEIIRRQQAEDRALPVPPLLAGLLEGAPLPWLIAMRDILNLPGSGVSAAAIREQVRGFLLTPGNVEKLLRMLPLADRKVLGHVAFSEEPVPLEQVTRRDGKQQQDGFNWDKRPAIGSFPRLRRMGLLFVGTMKGAPSVVVPADIRDRIRAALTPSS